MLKMNFQSRSKYFFILPYLVLAAMTALFLARAFFGFDWSDECYYLALPYRFVLGDRFFADSWDIHQTSAMLIAPVLWLYRLVVGNMTGVILFMRLFYVLVQSLVSLLIYRSVLRLYERRLPALLCAALFLSFTPFSISNFSYNSMGYLFTVTSAMLVFFLYSRVGSRRRACVLGALAGAALACACVSYPFFITVLLPFSGLLIGMRPSVAGKGGERKSLAPFAFFLAGGCFVAACAASFALIRTGFSGIAGNLVYLFEDPEHPYQSVFVKTSLFFKDYYHLVLLSLLQITLLVMILLYRRVKGGPDLSMIFPILIWVGLPLSLAVNIGMILGQPEFTQPLTAKVNLIQACAGFWPLILFVQKPSRRGTAVLLLMYIPSLLMCWAVYIVSNNGITGSAYALNLCVLSCVLLLYDHYAESSDGSAAQKRVRRALWAILTSSLTLLVFCNAALRLQAVYRDDSIGRLRVQMTDGPAAGIYTTSAAAARYAGILEDIRSAVPADGGRVMFNELLPFGYLCVEQKAAPPSIWRMELPSARVDRYFAQNPQNRPSLLYVVKSSYGLHNGTKPVTQQEAEKIMGSRAVMKETEYSYQFTKE